MKTRQELILDFMLAICNNDSFHSSYINDRYVDSVRIYKLACELADEYLRNL